MGAPGCDDAPLVEIGFAQQAKTVTMIYPYYDNPDFLSVQLQGWRCWPKELREHVRLIVIDDCSPSIAAADRMRSWLALAGERPFPMRVFRIEVDVRWNWLAARNIGAFRAYERGFYAGDQHDPLDRAALDQGGWLLLTDMDHIVGPGTMEMLVHGKHHRGIIYRFSRRDRKWVGTNDSRREWLGDWEETAIHPHPNSWFMTREMFWRVGGYDERMSGYYGSDSYYRRRCAATAPIRIMSNVALVRQEHDGDSSTLRYKRKQPEDAQLRPLVRGFKPGSKPLTLSFPYHEEQL
jgi:hypothetical protein